MSWYSSIYNGFIYGSVVAFLISLFNSGKLAYGGQVTGYSILSIGILLIMVVIFNYLSGKKTSSILNTIMTVGPFICMLGVIGFSLYMLIKYKTIIIEDKVSSNYKTFSNITLILLISQTILIIKNLNSESFKSSLSINKLTSSILYLFSVITLASSLIIWVILKYYTTDG